MAPEKTPIPAMAIIGCCCNISPYHSDQESIIVFDSGLWNCFGNPRLADGNPNVCTRSEYEAIAKRAATLGMKRRICCEINICGMPLCSHGWPLEYYQQTLNEEFPNFKLSITDHYQGCDDQGHWEFIVTIRPSSTKFSVVPQTQVMENRTPASYQTTETKKVPSKPIPHSSKPIPHSPKKPMEMDVDEVSC
eukprot:CAMPEP_0194167442 /NCGR_PEP_ID=MMETSP0154-20130528/2721_1 /TAXON_ID=1049557 /ORGANISM="Thalassiothrix antarctica, Strain L6-D1" /LENGTH=191 /DNA_ID=CAMNT_0038878345 /DNA_START=23 /DNA_END=598 /DNA_ORIENTATION=-